VNRRSIALLIAAAAISSAHGAVTEPKGLGDVLRAPAGEQPAFMLKAEGVQVYVCKPRAEDPKGFQWTFVGPEATLRENGAVVGRHAAGPVWESTSDKSSVKGAARAGQDGGAGNIPWLLLAGTPSPGTGKFAGVTSIQRVATKGGVEPTGGCDASKAGLEARVPYSADYYFYKRK
jgi:Protein of unknown function (DUF3455)